MLSVLIQVIGYKQENIIIISVIITPIIIILIFISIIISIIVINNIIIFVQRLRRKEIQFNWMAQETVGIFLEDFAEQKLYKIIFIG